MYAAITTHQAELTDLKFFIEKSTGFTQEWSLVLKLIISLSNAVEKNKSHVFHFGVMTPTVVPNTPHPTQVLCFPSIDAIQQRRCQEWRQTSRPETSVSESFEKLDIAGQRPFNYLDDIDRCCMILHVSTHIPNYSGIWTGLCHFVASTVWIRSLNKAIMVNSNLMNLVSQLSGC